MSRKNLVLLDIVIIAAVMIAAMIYMFMGPLGRRADISAKEKALAGRKQRLTQGVTPLEELKHLTESGLERVEKSVVPLESIALDISDDYSPEGKENPPNYFKQLLVGLRKKVAGGQLGPSFPIDTPLGFTAKMEEKHKDDVRPLLLRVAAAERLVEILKKTGDVKVAVVEHQPFRGLAGVEEIYPDAAMLPVQVRFYGTERQAALFLAALTSPGTAGALETFRTESAPDRAALKIEALVSFLITDAADVLPKTGAGTPGRTRVPASGQRPPIRRW